MNVNQDALLPIVEGKQLIDETHPYARRLFTAVVGDLPFSDIYADLLASGFTFREAAVIAWLSMGISNRVPSTQKELAAALGCSPAIISKIKRSEKAQLQLMKLTTASLISHAAEVDAALVEVATNPDYKSVRAMELFYKRIGAIQDKHEITMTPMEDIAMSNMTDDELRAIIEQLGAGEDE